MPQPLQLTDDEGKNWVAVGFVPQTGHLVMVPLGTEILMSPVLDEEESSIPPEAAAVAEGKSDIVLPPTGMQGD